MLSQSDFNFVQDHSHSDGTKETKSHKELAEPNDVVFKVQKHSRCKNVAFRKDIINKSIVRAFVKYYSSLFKFNIKKHMIDESQYDSLKDHICEVSNSTGLLELFLEHTINANEIGKPNIHYYLLSDFLIS